MESRQDKDFELSDKEALAEAEQAIHDAGGIAMAEKIAEKNPKAAAEFNRLNVIAEFAKEKATLGKELTKLISDFELRWNMVLVKTSCMVEPRDSTNPESMPVTRAFMCDFGC